MKKDFLRAGVIELKKVVSHRAFHPFVCQATMEAIKGGFVISFYGQIDLFVISIEMELNVVFTYCITEGEHPAGDPKKRDLTMSPRGCQRKEASDDAESSTIVVYWEDYEIC